MTNDPDNHAEDGTGRRAEHRAGEASDSRRRWRMSCMSKPFALSGTTDAKTLSTSEIVIVAVTVLGTLVAWLTGPHMALPPLPHDVSGMACEAPGRRSRIDTPVAEAFDRSRQGPAIPES
jgi:hypothetical protein